MMTIKVEQFVEKARRILDDFGLVVKHLDLSGRLALCGTTQRPQGTDGRYVIHLDPPATIWVCNYHDDGVGRTFPLYEQGELDAMPAAERAALQERIRQQKLAAQKEREERQRRVAKAVQRFLPHLPPAGAENPYLHRKGVRPAGNLCEMRDGRLVVPVYVESEGLTSFQRIFENGDKRFLRGGKIEGGFFPVPAANSSEAGPLLIGEGVATVLSACMATGYAGLAAFNAGNLKAVAEATRARHPERTIILLADNDIHSDGKANTGVEAATAAARAIGAKLTVCPAVDGRSTDFNDLHLARGLDAVREAVDAAEVMQKPSSMPEEWPAPVPFTSYTLPKLDAGNLPPILGEFCVELAEEKQVPVEIVVAMSLATLSTAAQWHYVVRIREGYREPLNLYTMCPLEPANRKSATVEACLAPLKEWEKWIAETMAQEVKAARSSRLTMEKAIEAKRSKAAHCKSMQDMEILQREIMEFEEQLPEIPVIPRLLADNTTPEALAVLMENMGGCIAIVTAEGGIFDILAGMYSKGTPNLDLFLKAHSGDSFRVDRRNSVPVMLEHPRLTLGISPQPVTLAERSASKVFRGRGLDGRFLYFMPESLLGRRKMEPSPMNPAVKSRFHEKIRSLLPMRWSKDIPEPAELELSQEAYRIWIDVAKVIEEGLAPGGEFEGMNDWGGKLAGAVGRIAGLFHLVTHDKPEEIKITAETMQQAAYMGALLTEHAKAAYALMGTDDTIEGAKKVYEWVRRQAADRFTVRECWQALKNQVLFPHVDAVKSALKELEDRGFIRELPTENKGTGRKPSPTYIVNPATLRR